MPALPVILNNTPLVALWLLDHFPVLLALYETVWIPRAVEVEFLATDTVARQRALTSSPWIQTIDLRNPKSALAYTGLDRGEAEVLALAIEHDAKLVVIDERKGRQYAQRLGLPVTGTLGLLLLAKEKGMISQLSPLLYQLQTAGLYFHPTLLHKILVLAEEAPNQ